MERSVLIKGLFLDRDSYVLGVTQAFMQKEGALRGQTGKIGLLVDNVHYTNELESRQLLKTRQLLKIQHQPITTQFLQQTSLPVALYVDRHDFGAYSHYPHFVVLVDRFGERFSVLTRGREDIKVGQFRSLIGH